MQTVTTRMTGASSILAPPSYEVMPFLAKFAMIAKAALPDASMAVLLATVLAGSLLINVAAAVILTHKGHLLVKAVRGDRKHEDEDEEQRADVPERRHREQQRLEERLEPVVEVLARARPEESGSGDPPARLPRSVETLIQTLLRTNGVGSTLRRKSVTERRVYA